MRTYEFDNWYPVPTALFQTWSIFNSLSKTKPSNKTYQDLIILGCVDVEFVMIAGNMKPRGKLLTLLLHGSSQDNRLTFTIA